MIMGNVDDVRLGRQVVAESKLLPLRRKINLAKSAMAELLYTSRATYESWEARPATILWPETAGRLGRFYRAASNQLDLLQEQGVDVSRLVPLHAACTVLAVPQETMMRWYRDGLFDAVDLGILGLWLHKGDLLRMRSDRTRKLWVVRS